MPTNRTLDKQSVATYVACLLDAAKDANRVFEDLEELRDIQKAVNSSSQLREFLQNQSVPAQNKAAFMRDAFGETAPEVISTIAVMTERGDIRLLGRMVEGFEKSAESATGTVVVDVTTAVPLDDHLRDVIKAKMKAELGADIRLNEKVDRSILGGIIMSAHGKRMDASVKAQLDHARAMLSVVPSGGDK